MSHNLEFNKQRGTYSFFTKQEVAWHKLGTVVDRALTSEEAIVMANLDYEVALGETFIKYMQEDIPKFGKGSKIYNTYVTYRRDTGEILMNNGKALTNRYTIVQNKDAFTFFDDIVGRKEAIFETAGVLGKGETIFITAKLPDNIRVKGTNDIIDKYLLFTNSHDGSGVVQVLFTPIRVVCNNTLNLALSSAKSSNIVRFKHTASVHNNLKQGLEILNLYDAYLTNLSEVLSQLKDTQINFSDNVSICSELILSKEELELLDKNGGRLYNIDEISTRKKNIIRDMVNYIEQGVGQEYHYGTALWLYNGISSYLNNQVEFKDYNDKFNSLFMNGREGTLSQKAFELITKNYLS